MSSPAMPLEPSLNPQWVTQEVGTEHVQFLNDLIADHLCCEPSPNDIHYRIAPSMIARSECELFSVSAPRFAIRATLPDGSYLNLRRIGFLEKTCADIPVQGAIPTNLAQALRNNIKMKGAAIADSVLIPPYDRYPVTDWFILTSNLGRRYGEVCDPQQNEVYGTPYLRQMLLGGGMCAQAACYMANAIMLEHARGLFGIAEITALSSERVRRGDEDIQILISGMNLPDMSNFLSSEEVNLRATIQRSTTLVSPRKHPVNAEAYVQLQMNAIRSYILSGFPVILHFDYRTLASARAYKRCGHLLAKSTKRLSHAVVFVGCRLRRSPSFLVNDPSFLPFRRLDTAELCKAIDVGPNSVAPILAITPDQAWLPFFSSHSEPSKATFGVLDMLVRLLRSNDPIIRKLLPDNHPAIDPQDECRLVHSREMSWISTLSRGDSVPAEVISKLASWTKTVDGRAIDWLWSVHRHSPATADIQEWFLFLDASTKLTAGEWTAAHERLPVLAIIRETGKSTWRLCPLNRRHVRPAVITSFSTKSSIEASKRLPSKSAEPSIQAVEWYAFMQTDCQTQEIRDFTQRYGLSIASVVDFMAQCVRENRLREAIKILLRSTPTEYPVVALATFVPLLSLPPNSHGALIGIDALYFVAQFAAELRGNQPNLSHPRGNRPIVIEVVAGSRVSAIASDRQQGFLASFVSDKTARENFLANLSTVVDRCGHPSTSIIWAIELEPGPLFTCRDWQSLLDICSRLDQDPKMRHCVGVNLDIGHWRMTSANPRLSTPPISPEVVRNSHVFRRIVHAHISGHDPKAHFGDIGLTAICSDEDYLPWIALLRQRAALTDGAMPYSGYVSLELEACKSSSIAKAQMRELALLLARTI